MQSPAFSISCWAAAELVELNCCPSLLATTFTSLHFKTPFAFCRAQVQLTQNVSKSVGVGCSFRCFRMAANMQWFLMVFAMWLLEIEMLERVYSCLLFFLLKQLATRTIIILFWGVAYLVLQKPFGRFHLDKKWQKAIFDWSKDAVPFSNHNRFIGLPSNTSSIIPTAMHKVCWGPRKKADRCR